MQFNAYLANGRKSLQSWIVWFVPQLANNCMMQFSWNMMLDPHTIKESELLMRIAYPCFMKYKSVKYEISTKKFPDNMNVSHFFKRWHVKICISKFLKLLNLSWLPVPYLEDRTATMCFGTDKTSTTTQMSLVAIELKLNLVL